MQSLSQAATAAYYLDMQQSHRSGALYYCGGEEPDGVWWNPKGLFELSHGGVIDSASFSNLYTGMSPDGEKKLVQNAGKVDRSAGLDLTFSADKSVSALWALAGDDLRSTIEACHNDAARVSLEGVAETYCAYTRRGRNGAEVLRADILGALFQHGTSRENDPQLHTHCVIFNVAKDHEEGKWRALHQKPFYHWVKAGGAVYRHALAWNLRERLGIQTEVYGPERDRVRIVGMPEDLLQHWSKRASQIDRARAQLGLSADIGSHLAKAITLSTRQSKETDGSSSHRDERFRLEAEGFVQCEQLIASVLDVCDVHVDEAQVRALMREVGAIPSELTVNEAAFKLGDVVAAAANRTAGMVRPEALGGLVGRIKGHEAVIEMDEMDRRYPADAAAGLEHTRFYSTVEEVGEEIELGEMAVRMQARSGFLVEAGVVDEKLDEMAMSGIAIDGEQKRAVHHLAGDGAVAVLEGAAGSGKTVALRPVADLYKERGYRVLATSVAWRAAIALGTDCDVQPLAVSKLLRLAGGGKLGLNDRTVIMVDEAGMMSVRQTHRLLSVAERVGAKVILVGEREQQQPVEAGPGFRLVVDQVASVRLGSIRRQLADLEDIIAHEDGVDRETARLQAGMMPAAARALRLGSRSSFDGAVWQSGASKAFRDQKARNGLQAYASRGCVHLGDDLDGTMDRLVKDWSVYRADNPGKATIVMARTNAEVRELSERMRMVSLPAVGDRESVMIETSKGEGAKRIVSSLEVSPGDLLRIGATNWEKRLFNGTIVRVGAVGEEVGPDGVVRVRIEAQAEHGDAVSFYADDITDFYGNVRLDYGYALTITSAQGATADRAFLLTDEKPARETIYPAATRHRDALSFYLNRRPLVLAVKERRPEDEWERPVSEAEMFDYLGVMWSRDGSKIAALDQASEDQKRVLAEQAHGHRQQRSAEQMAALLRASMVEGVADRDGNQAANQADSEVAALLRRVCAWKDVFSEADIRRAVLAGGASWGNQSGKNQSGKDMSPQGVMEEVRVILAHGDVVPLFDRNSPVPRYTLVQVHARNQSLGRLAGYLGRVVPGRAGERYGARVRKVAARYGLKEQHYELADAVATSGGLTVIKASEGEVRRAVLATAADALASDGSQVIGLASSMRGLKAFDLAPVQTWSISGFLSQLTAGKIALAPDTVVMVADSEAVDADTMLLLMKAAHQARFSLVLSGDPYAQVARGGAYRWLLGEHEAAASRGTFYTHPSHVPDHSRPGLDAACGGVWAGTLRDLDRDGALFRHDDKGSLHDSVAQHWVAADRAGEGLQLVIARTASEAQALNHAVHELRHEHTDTPPVGLSAVRPIYDDKDGVVTRSQSAPAALDVRAGDYLRLLANDRQSGLENGDIGRVVAVTKRRVVLDIDGREVRFDPRRYKTFDLGYAVTQHQARSLTADRVHVVHNPYWHSGEAFRAFTRHRAVVSLYTDGGMDQHPDDIAASIEKTMMPSCTLDYQDRHEAVTELRRSGEHEVLDGVGDDALHQMRVRDGDQWRALEEAQRHVEAPVEAWQRARAGSAVLKVASAVSRAVAPHWDTDSVVSYAQAHAVLHRDLDDIRKQARVAGQVEYSMPEYDDIMDRWSALGIEGNVFVSDPASYGPVFTANTAMTLFDVARSREQFARVSTSFGATTRAHEAAEQLFEEQHRQVIGQVGAEALADEQPHAGERAEIPQRPQSPERSRDDFVNDYVSLTASFHKKGDAYVEAKIRGATSERIGVANAEVTRLANRLYAVTHEFEKNIQIWEPHLARVGKDINKILAERGMFQTFTTESPQVFDVNNHDHRQHQSTASASGNHKPDIRRMVVRYITTKAAYEKALEVHAATDAFDERNKELYSDVCRHATTLYELSKMMQKDTAHWEPYLAKAGLSVEEVREYVSYCKLFVSAGEEMSMEEDNSYGMDF